MNLNLFNDVPDGLTRRARSFVQAHGVKVDVRHVEDHRQWWLERDVPAAVIDRMAAHEERWGGLVLPPASQYDGGPRYLEADPPEGSASEGWWFEAGMQRTAVPYRFTIGPSGEFGTHSGRWMPLHATVEGWVESLALTHHASMWAKQIIKVTGDDVDGIVADTFEPVREVMGLADTWWRGADSLVAVYTDEAEALSFPRGRTALIYSGLDEWGLQGGVKDSAS
ncbi:hypothetical protein QFZ75_001754 [Streptomyces sp. V3I8]|uniref:hypothetical protein n=1 Tax=Streptomyces sp. V3I8 TaxID=3042279 RepID=UPI0027836A4C|nr:hypothetical protein [Streptomyces sp. V3I8]MDQ1035338.1 hypothetical protein [Streptomyces sp. V3I8]